MSAGADSSSSDARASSPLAPYPPISMVGALWGIAKLALRRQFNFLQLMNLKKKRRSLLLPVLMGCCIFLAIPFQGVFFAYNICQKVAISVAESEGRIILTLREEGALPSPRQSAEPTFDAGSTESLERAVRNADRYHDSEGALNELGRQRVEDIQALFLEQGHAGFLHEGNVPLLMGAPKRGAERLLGLILMVGFLGILGSSVGVGITELGKVSWSFEWLHTFPISSRTLVLAKIFEYSFVNVAGILFLTPYLLTVFLLWNDTSTAAVAALCATLFTLLLYGGLRVLLENVLRRFFSPDKLKNIQAVASLSGMLLMFAVMVGSQPNSMVEGSWINSVNENVLAAVQYFPTSWVFSFPLWGNWQWLAWGIAIPGVALLCASLSARTLRQGLVSATTHLLPQQRRSSAARPLGILRKEALRLARDKNFAVATLVVPLVIMGLQLVIGNKLFFENANGAWNAAIAFGVCAYSLVFSTITSVAQEGNALWLSFTFPQPLHRVFRRRSMLWGMVFAAYVLAIGTTLNTVSNTWSLEAAALLLFAVAGIAVYAYIGTGIGLLGTRLTKGGPHRAPVRPLYAYLFMLLAAMYGTALVSGNLSNVAVALILALLLSEATWGRAADHVRYLFDQEDRPLHRFDLLDALLAIALFSTVLSGINSIVNVARNEIDPDAVHLTSYLVASALALALVAFIASYRDSNSGQERLAGRAQKTRTARSDTLYLGLGVLTGLLAAAYHGVLLSATGDNAFEFPHQLSGSANIGLALAVAPWVEELLFRRYLVGGLLGHRGARESILISAFLFAMVHPLASFPTIFVLGLACAWTYQRSGRLSLCIGIHFLHNSCAILAATLT